ncbi:hypothetical protein [Pseudodesulfovibrio piezophilus]|uniref:Uncharacterized protein n=1 Tax=Pseudodesulfovibrio piezophilus (strain DSM 21447 / JCM 15486 / C1TLV30) TaxID=1322246 RepID=M1WNH8_PSEP2|nr:hypothetical protein [Pseudodesulfovibrio piezophilus]CCH50360.1 conserved protein of unknown function [Pseudodesulfovibrio piezophilus C1TLV30]
MSESYLEKALLKLARQINAYDEASLMSLWDKYAEKVANFEPTKRWEESVLIFNLIQSTRMKNQLFNYNWAQSRMPNDPPMGLDLAALTAPEPTLGSADDREDCEESSNGCQSDAPVSKQDRRGKLLTLTPKNRK